MAHKTIEERLAEFIGKWLKKQQLGENESELGDFYFNGSINLIELSEVILDHLEKDRL